MPFLFKISGLVNEYEIEPWRILRGHATSSLDYYSHIIKLIIQLLADCSEQNQNLHFIFFRSNSLSIIPLVEETRPPYEWYSQEQIIFDELLDYSLSMNDDLATYFNEEIGLEDLKEEYKNILDLKIDEMLRNFGNMNNIYLHMTCTNNFQNIISTEKLMDEREIRANMRVCNRNNTCMNNEDNQMEYEDNNQIEYADNQNDYEDNRFMNNEYSNLNNSNNLSFLNNLTGGSKNKNKKRYRKKKKNSKKKKKLFKN